MKHNIEFKGFEAKAEVQKLIDRLIRSIERKSRNFSPDEVMLRVAIDGNQAHGRYRISVTLAVPGKTLAAGVETHEVEAGVRQAFAEIETQLADHKAALQGERLWKRLAR